MRMPEFLVLQSLGQNNIPKTTKAMKMLYSLLNVSKFVKVVQT